MSDKRNIKLRTLSTDAKCNSIKGSGIRIKQSNIDDRWYWYHVYSSGRLGPICNVGFNNKEDAVEDIRAFKRDLSNDELPIYICIGE